jgi:hypothetical protein
MHNIVGCWQDSVDFVTIRLSSGLDESTLWFSIALHKRAVRLSSALDVCRVRSARERAFVECTRQPIRLSRALGKIAVRLSSALDKRALLLSRTVDKQCVCRVHSTSNAFVDCTRQAVRLSSALDKYCVCQVPSAKILLGARQIVPIGMHLSSAMCSKSLIESSAHTLILICARSPHPTN